MAADPAELMTTHLELIERAIGFACRRHRLDADESDEFGAVAKLRLVENNYSILRQYEERCKFATFISIVVQRMLLDYRNHLWGKWHASAEAKRLGPLALEVEQLVVRDGRTLGDAHAVLHLRFPEATLESLSGLLERLPKRAPRRRAVDLEEAETVAVASLEHVQEPLYARERRGTAQRLSAAMSDVIASMPDEDRLILQLHFQGSMTVAQIARALALEQKALYRRLEHRMRDMRKRLLAAGLTSGEVLDLIGRNDNVLEFDMRIPPPRPSIAIDGTVATQPEGK